MKASPDMPAGSTLSKILAAGCIVTTTVIIVFIAGFIAGSAFYVPILAPGAIQ